MQVLCHFGGNERVKAVGKKTKKKVVAEGQRTGVLSKCSGQGIKAFLLASCPHGQIWVQKQAHTMLLDFWPWQGLCWCTVPI